MSVIIGGFLLDLIFGDPHGFPHPVRLMGWVIAALDKLLNKKQKPMTKIALGGLMVVLVVSFTLLITYGILLIASLIHPYVNTMVGIFLAYTILATKSLHKESEKVLKALEQNNLPEARKMLSYLVSRDTTELEEYDIVRGTIETISENISDGVIAPLFYLMIGGVPLAMAYKAINTMDSMVGYKNEKYLYFGRIPARLDDLVNYIPARVSAILIALAAALLRLKGYAALTTALKDGRKHDSPNSGYPEAAAAGALSIQLGGENRYFNRIVMKPTIGVPKEPLTRVHISRMIQLLYGTATITVVMIALVKWIGRG